MPYHGQARMARAALEWGIRDLAKAALVSHDTVIRFERGENLKPRTVDAIREAFARHGVEFIAGNGGGPGVRLARPAKAKAKRKATKR
jgi:transcriptional regulator with XRE-family HTH domain